MTRPFHFSTIGSAAFSAGLAISFLALTGCSGSGGGGNSTVTPAAQTTIGPAGGTVQATDPASPLFGSMLVVPPGAVTAEILFTISSAAGRPSGYEDAGSYVFVDIGPDGTIFQVPAVLTLPYGDAGPGGAQEPPCAAGRWLSTLPLRIPHDRTRAVALACTGPRRSPSQAGLGAPVRGAAISRGFLSSRKAS